MEPPADTLRSRSAIELPGVEGEVVELLLTEGRCLATVRLTASVVLDLTGSRLADVHLGDRVALVGSVTVQRL